MLRCCRLGATADDTSPPWETCFFSRIASENGGPSHLKVLVFQIELSSCIRLFVGNAPITSLLLTWSTPVSWIPHAGTDQPPTCLVLCPCRSRTAASSWHCGITLVPVLPVALYKAHRHPNTRHTFNTFVAIVLVPGHFFIVWLVKHTLSYPVHVT